MDFIAKQPYVKMERQVSSIQQTDVEDERTLYLYKDRITTKYREFSIDEIMDISFRKLGEYGGILYLHTKQGVFPYTVKTSPQEFINLYRKHIKDEE
ncbi:hypothetical protein [Ornithinibacillus halophilus]|uniref:PH domain-containing protein n=1 Tax=Ornithinibacillus halophilus TaxID=930117 RepID=A0A1M5L4I1_9BACI|nr:hypothetical protein [Ornithinibacillus halophilus]SHG59896.1 hypothetical protein SAMN05216225_10447 [Ornithinibacillus halophilus]